KGIFTRLLSQGDSSRAFRSSAEVDRIKTAAGFPDNWEDYAQFPRVVTFRGQTSGNTAKVTESILTKNLVRVGDDWYMGREANEGLFVMAKRIRARNDATEAAFDDTWVLFKT